MLQDKRECIQHEGNLFVWIRFYRGNEFRLPQYLVIMIKAVCKQIMRLLIFRNDGEPPIDEGNTCLDFDSHTAENADDDNDNDDAETDNETVTLGSFHGPQCKCSIYSS